MQWNDHSRIEGRHATFSASKYNWLNYTDDKLVTVYDNMKAKERGTVLHAFAATCIRLGQKLPRSHKTLNQYVNDAIGFRMDPEVLLYYSDDFLEQPIQLHSEIIFFEFMITRAERLRRTWSSF